MNIIFHFLVPQNEIRKKRTSRGINSGCIFQHFLNKSSSSKKPAKKVKAMRGWCFGDARETRHSPHLILIYVHRFVAFHSVSRWLSTGISHPPAVAWFDREKNEEREKRSTTYHKTKIRFIHITLWRAAEPRAWFKQNHD